MSAWWDPKQMPSVEERLAYLEGRVDDQATLLADVRSEVRELRVETGAHLTSLRNAMDARFGAMDGRFATMDTRFATMEARFVAIDGKITWLIGIQVAMLLMFAGAALSVVFK